MQLVNMSLSIAAAVITPNIGGWLGSLITRPNIKSWYENLQLPAWRPPNWAFGPVWTTIYCGMGYASHRVYVAGGGFEGAARLPLTLYGTQLALNWLWTPIFFGAHRLGLSLVEIICLYGTVLATTHSFYKLDQVAGYLMIPYIGWLTLATALNYVIWRDNKDKKSE